MNEVVREFAGRYASAMRRHLTASEEAVLEAAYELGRSAIARGLGVLEMARIHQETLIVVLCGIKPEADCKRTLKAAEIFFLETLSPFEVTHRGFREANRRLEQLIQTLEERNNQLADANRELKNEMAERQRTELALRESEDSLRKLSHKVLHAQEEERTRISRELHDEVGQSLTAVNVTLAMLRRCGPAEGSPFRKPLASAQKLLEETMESVHRFARELRPAMLDDLGLLPALRSYTNAFAARTGIRVTLRASRLVELLDSEKKTVIFRVAQESLTNVAKHAHATQVEITIRHDPRRLQMILRDNGRSFPVEKTLGSKGKKRLGLVGMQERVRLVDGQLRIESKRGHGTSVCVEIPHRVKRIKKIAAL